MKHVDAKEIVCLTVIAGRKQRKALLAAISVEGGRLINLTYGKGSGKVSYLRDMFGFVPEEQKVVIMCLMRREKVDGMYSMLAEKFNFNKPNTGIAFTIPVNGLAY